MHTFHRALVIADKTTFMRDLIHTVASKISSKWRAVGKVLKLPTGTLDRIQKCNALKPNKDIASCEHMLYIWMQQDLLYKVQPFSPFTWQSIIEALREPSVGEVDLAEKLTKKHIHASTFAIYKSIGCSCQWKLPLYTCS